MSSSCVNAIVTQVRTQGFAVVPGNISKEETRYYLGLVKSLKEQKIDKTLPQPPRLDQGQHTIYNLQNKSVELTKLVLSQETIRTVLSTLLNDPWHRAINLNQPNYILRSLSARNNQIAAPMHIDSLFPYQGEHVISMQVAVILEDQTEENGCTVLVPESHLSGCYVAQEQRKEAISLETKSGDLVFWDSRIWHGTNTNLSGASRWSLIGTFVRWWIKQGYKITTSLPQHVFSAMTDEEKAILGFCSIPFRDEYEGIDFKTGLADIRDHVEDYQD